MDKHLQLLRLFHVPGLILLQPFDAFIALLAHSTITQRRISTHNWITYIFPLQYDVSVEGLTCVARKCSVVPLGDVRQARSPGTRYGLDAA